MKLQVTQENLNNALGHVARIANSRTTLPILSNVLLKTVNNRLSVAATNLDIAITQYLGAKVSQEGSITVPARLTQDFIASLPSGVIDLNLKEHRLDISTDKYKSVINGTPADDYPVMPSIKDGTSWSVPSDVLKKALQQVVLAASGDESRPVLTGVYLHTTDGTLYVAATDSYRLGEKELIKTKQEINVLVPANALQDLLRILADNNEAVEVTHDEQQIMFKVADVELMARLIEGKYPDYKKLIPTSFAVSAKLKKTDFINITKVSSLFARESAGSVSLNISEEEKQVSIHSIASQLGENTAEAIAEVVGSGEITLNSRYLLDALGAIGDDEVTLQFNGKLEACVLRGASDNSYTHLIMPLKS